MKQKSRQIIFNKKDLAVVMETLAETRITWDNKIGYVKFGNCGWADDPEAYFVLIHCKENLWYKIINELNSKVDFKIKL